MGRVLLGLSGRRWMPDSAVGIGEKRNAIPIYFTEDLPRCGVARGIGDARVKAEEPHRQDEQKRNTQYKEVR